MVLLSATLFYYASVELRHTRALSTAIQLLSRVDKFGEGNQEAFILCYSYMHGDMV
jgi:hypothetical protein